VNDHGRASAGALLRVRQVEASDTLVLRAFNEARREIDQAINNTLRALLEPGTRPDPFRLSRFPDAVARRTARPAELFERALLHIRRLVESGRYANATEDFRYEESLSIEQVGALQQPRPAPWRDAAAAATSSVASSLLPRMPIISSLGNRRPLYYA
jgi:peroxidase